jgi:hypothetical protein
LYAPPNIRYASFEIRDGGSLLSLLFVSATISKEKIIESYDTRYEMGLQKLGYHIKKNKKAKSSHFHRGMKPRSEKRWSKRENWEPMEG